MALADEIKLNPAELNRFGRLLIKFIREEAKRDAALSPQIPDTREFYESFSYRLDGNSVVVESTWDWVNTLVDGTNGPYPMKWLTAAQGVKKIPMRDKQGNLIFRSTPLTTDKAWIHPGVARHTFIQRAFDRAQEEMASMVMDAVMRKVFGG